jgi:pimeloyl-ACP methyl ester carboxylesterase
MIRFLLFLPLLVFIAYAIYGTVRYTRMIGNIFLSLVYRPQIEPSVSTMGERVTILDSADREIEALVVENEDARKVAVFCHESGAGKESWEKYIYFLPSIGFNVLSLDFKERHELQDAPNSLAQWPTKIDVRKVLTAVRWARKAWRSDLEFYFFGVSNGADIAFAASLEEPGVKAVVADGLFSMKEIFRDYIRKWAPILVRPNFFGEKYPDWVVNHFTNLGFWYSERKSRTSFVDVEDLLKKKHPPLLVIHGAEDDYVPGTHQKHLEKVASKDRNFLHYVVPQAGHNEAVKVARRDYEAKITGFLRGIR